MSVAVAAVFAVRSAAREVVYADHCAAVNRPLVERGHRLRRLCRGRHTCLPELLEARATAAGTDDNGRECGGGDHCVPSPRHLSLLTRSALAKHSKTLERELHAGRYRIQRAAASAAGTSAQAPLPGPMQRS